MQRSYFWHLNPCFAHARRGVTSCACCETCDIMPGRSLCGRKGLGCGYPKASPPKATLHDLSSTLGPYCTICTCAEWSVSANTVTYIYDTFGSSRGAMARVKRSNEMTLYCSFTTRQCFCHGQLPEAPEPDG